MPHLVKGLMRFTDDDFLMQDFQETAQLTYKATSFAHMNELLQIEVNQLVYMRDDELLKLFDTRTNIKQSLKNALLLIAAIAGKEGYTLPDLMKE